MERTHNDNVVEHSILAVYDYVDLCCGWKAPNINVSG